MKNRRRRNGKREQGTGNTELETGNGKGVIEEQGIGECGIGVSENRESGEMKNQIIGELLKGGGREWGNT